jgi:exopolysaccharide biosynthesis polyprenyl glycosylphosphotransferase
MICPVLRRHITALRLSLMIADALVAAGVFTAVSMIRFGPGWAGVWADIGIPAPIGMAAWAIVWITVVWQHGLYRMRTHWSLQADAARLTRALLLVAIAVFVVLFVINLPEVSRLFLATLFGVQLVVALASRILIRTAFRLERGRGSSARFVLLAGTTPMAERFADMIEAHRELGLRVIGHLGSAPAPGQPAPKRPILGSLEDVETVLHEQIVDEVAICLDLQDWAYVEAITRICAEEGKIVRIPADGAVPHLVGAYVEQYGGLTIQSLVYGPDRILSMVAKRLMDVTGALVLLVLTSPFLLAIGLAIRLSDGGPMVFRQPRVGLHGRIFQVLKFRTMVTDAEEQLDDLAQHNEISGPAFKITDDPRITRIGRFLRRTSLDELPQLWNVLRGDMSLVGPRPPLPREVEDYDIWHRRRLSMKPGITGLWQISERRNEDFDRWVAIDLDYIDSWSLWLDIKIIFRTLPAMLEGR